MADGANALIYLAEGDKVNAALSAASMLPVGGQAATAAKWGKKGIDAAHAGKATKAVTKAEKEVAEQAAKKEAKQEAAEAGGKKANGSGGGKDKKKLKGKKPDCGKRGPYNKQDGDFQGHEMERDHMPSAAAMKEAAMKRLRERKIKLDLDQIAALKGRVERHAQTIALPNDVHAQGETFRGRNTDARIKDDSGNLATAAKRGNAAHRKNIKADKHKDCAGALKKAADEIDAITEDQYEKFFDNLIGDVVKGRKTTNPWNGVL